MAATDQPTSESENQALSEAAGSRRNVRAVTLPSGQIAFVEEDAPEALEAVPGNVAEPLEPDTRPDTQIVSAAPPEERPEYIPRPRKLSAAEYVAANPIAPLDSSLLQNFRVPERVAGVRRRTIVSLAPDQLLRISVNPVPVGTVCGTLRTADHVQLRFARIPASVTPTRGTVVILQGRGEFIEKYFETAQDLSRRGFCVATFDFRGQGRSERQLRNPHKGHVDDFGEYVLDIEAVMRGLVLPDCPPPYFLLAHSAGSLAALLTAGARPDWFDRVVLVAPFLGVPEGRFTGLGKAAVTVLDTLGLGAAYVPGGRSGPMHLRTFLKNPFTSDPVRYRRIARVLRTAPELALGSPTVGWVQAAQRAIRQTTSDRFTAHLPVPVLAIAAGADRVVDNAAIEHFGRMLQVGGTIVLPNSQHEILVERDSFRDLFWAAFDQFVPGSSPLT